MRRLVVLLEPAVSINRNSTTMFGKSTNSDTAMSQSNMMADPIWVVPGCEKQPSFLLNRPL